MILPYSNPLTRENILLARAYVWTHTGGTWLSLYQEGLGRELTDDEVVFAYLVAKNADRVAEETA
jgi:hypothetical protein